MSPIESQELPMIVSALLFVVQKYEPTERMVYESQQVITRLFRANTTMRPEVLKQWEKYILSTLDFEFEVVTPYDFISIFGGALGLNTE
jgi:hypothetical protein